MTERYSRVRLWRCTECQKWSHAKTDPKKHRRWVKPEDAEYSSALNENSGDPHVPDGHFVDCGPFDAWIAEYDRRYRYTRAAGAR